MKMLTKEQIRQKAKTSEALASVAQELREAIALANEQMDTIFNSIEELEGRYNELVGEANTFVEAIHDQQDAYMDERSETWHTNDSGDAYRDWAGEWTVSLEEIQIDRPEAIEEPEMDGVESFRDLPEHP